MDKIVNLLKPQNIRILLFLLGIALLGRSFATIDPQFGMTIFSPDEKPQAILDYFNVEVDRYIMTMLWPLVYALLNSLHTDIKVTKPFFYTVIGMHIISLIISLVWYLNYIPPTYQNLPADQLSLVTNDLEHGLTHMKQQALYVFLAGIGSSIFAIEWFKKGWVIFQPNSND